MTFIVFLIVADRGEVKAKGFRMAVPSMSVDPASLRSARLSLCGVLSLNSVSAIAYSTIAR